MNPPYLSVNDWIDKFLAHGHGTALFNARVETKWFQRLASAASLILIPKGRIEFHRPDKKPGHPPVGSALIAIGKADAAALKKSGIPGLILKNA